MANVERPPLNQRQLVAAAVSASKFTAGEHTASRHAVIPRGTCPPRTLVGRERGDDLFKARITSQRVPPRLQLQVAVADTARKAAGAGKLFAGEVFVADGSGDSRQTHDHARAFDRIFFWGKQLNRAPGLAQRFLFSPQGSVD